MVGVGASYLQVIPVIRRRETHGTRRSDGDWQAGDCFAVPLLTSRRRSGLLEAC
jgi:hypothetical protein